MLFLRGLICFAVLFLAASSVRAADPEWTEVRSAHFVLFTDTTAVKGQRLLTDLEGRVAALSEAVGDIPTRSFPVEVFLFGKSESFLETAPKLADGVEFRKSAYLVRGPDRIFVVARDKAPADIAEDVGHALGHVFVERLSPWRPFWFSEGAAEYFRKAGSNPDTKRVAEKDGYPVSDLLEIVPSAAYDDDAPSTSFRILSHRLLRVLLDRHRAELGEYLRSLEIIEEKPGALAVSAETLEAELAAYTEARIASVPSPGGLRTQAIAPEGMAVHRGDLMLAARNTSEAAAWYNGDAPEARAARAILARFSRSGDEPFRVLERASRDLPENGLLQFHFGSVASQSRDGMDLQVQALTRAVDLLPLLGRAHGELARIYAASDRPELALEEVDKAIALEPEFADQFVVTRAEAMLALSRFDEARTAIQLASDLPHSDKSTNYGFKISEMNRRIEEIRRTADAKRLDQIRAEVAAKVAELEPPPPPPPPPPPARAGEVAFEIQTRTQTELLNSVMPLYPNALVQKGVSGTIVLQLAVGADGRISQSSIVSSEVPELSNPTLDAVKKWTFRPAQIGGRPVPFDLRVVFRFIVR